MHFDGCHSLCYYAGVPIRNHRVNKDEERPFVLAHFSLARTLQKQQKEKGNYEPGDVESLKRCLH
eukprot:2983319-Prorocentrum_lima.AAC.1